MTPATLSEMIESCNILLAFLYTELRQYRDQSPKFKKTRLIYPHESSITKRIYKYEGIKARLEQSLNRVAMAA